jgi:hypothetical protein
MDMEILKKRISTFRGEGGAVRITDDHLYMEILHAWEQWKGTSKDFFRTIGVSKSGLAAIIGKAKRMRREGHFPAEEFKEIQVSESPTVMTSLMSGPCSNGVEILWDGGKLIRFSQVEQLIDFLKKVS